MMVKNGKWVPTTALSGSALSSTLDRLQPPVLMSGTSAPLYVPLKLKK